MYTLKVKNKNKKESKSKSKIIGTIQKIRTKNNKNWMDLMRLAFKYAPNESAKVMKRINMADKKISLELKKLYE